MPWLCSLLTFLVAVGAGVAGDWPQWLGVHRDGTTDEKITAWEKAPKVAWKQAVGEGHSSPVIAGGRVFLHTKVKDRDAEQIQAFDAKTGKELWTTSYERGKFGSIFGVGPRATPLVDGDLVYTFGVTGILACWRVNDGEKVWMVDTTKDFKPPALRFGVSGSPIVVDGNVLVNVGAMGASIVAFDGKTGKVAWQSCDDPPSYASPTLIGKGKARQVIFLTQKGVVSLDPENGKQYWKVPLVDLLNESSTTPVVIGDQLLASSVTFGSLGIQLSSKGGQPHGEQIWRNRKLTCYFSTPTAVDDKHLFMLTGSIIPPPKANLRCVEIKTGKELWVKEKVAKYHAAMLRTGNGKLLMLDDNGYLTLLAPNVKKYEELARSKVCGATWAHPALANGRIYLRDDNVLLCLEP